MELSFNYIYDSFESLNTVLKLSNSNCELELSTTENEMYKTLYVWVESKRIRPLLDLRLDNTDFEIIILANEYYFKELLSLDKYMALDKNWKTYTYVLKGIHEFDEFFTAIRKIFTRESAERTI